MGEEIGTDHIAKRQRHRLYDTVPSQAESIDHWVQVAQWPKALFHMDSRTQMRTQMLAKKRPSSRKRSVDGSTVSSQSSNHMTRDEKSAPYRDPMYEEQLKLKGFDMRIDLDGPNQKSLEMVQTLLEQQPTVPQDSLFAEHKFKGACEMMRNRNEARLVRDVATLIVPSPEIMDLDGNLDGKDLIESVDEGWNLTEPITPVRPQPDFSVGFKRDAFTEEQLDKIRPILGDSRSLVSRLRATWNMYLPFVASEIKCGSGALDVADRQNFHSMGIAVRAIVHLFQLINHEHEINREILAFSVSHDDRYVRIYGYYPIIKEEVTYRRHLIHDINIQAKNGSDRWTSYKFIKSVYQTWVSPHLQRIRTLLDTLPPDGADLILQQNAQTGLSRALTESQLTNTDANFELELENLPRTETRHTPETSVTSAIHETAGTTMERTTKKMTARATSKTSKSKH